MKQRFASLLTTAGLLSGLLLGSVGVPAASAATNLDSLGTDFWLAFPGNITTPVLTLFITGPTATTGTVAAPGVAFSATFTVTPGTVTSVIVPSSLDIQTSDTVGNLGIHVTSADEVTVYGLNRRLASTDAYLGLPTDILGTEYLVQGYKNSNIVNGTEFAIVAAQDTTLVTINPTVTTDGHTAGTPYNVTLNAGQTYQLRNTGPAPADLSGSIVTANKPVAVFGGHECANIPAGFTFCDHIVEEMTPTATWGKSFVTEPLATRTGDTFRFLADTDTTTVNVNGVFAATLNRGQLFEQILTPASVITSDKPILVTQYSNSTSFDNVTSDPFEVVVPPFEQFLNSYTVTTPATGFLINYINVVAPTASVGTVKLDGVVVPGASFTAIGSSTFSGAQLAVGLGSHTLDGAQPFGVTVYGFAEADSYGYPGGLSLAPVATVTSLVLTPEVATNPVNTEHCLTATVKDQNGVAVVGVRVDFTVTGVNPTSGFANTIADGTAPFCYTGTNTGDDSIGAAVGTISDTAIKHWTGVATTGTITIVKNTIGANGTFTFVVSGFSPNPSINTTSNTGTTGPITVTAGAHSVTENSQPSWVQSSAICSSGTPAGFTVPVGENVTCTFANTFQGEGSTLTDGHLWLGLRNSDDQGTQFDVKIELIRGTSVLASGLTRCITNLTRNPALAKQITVPWDASPVSFASGDVVKVSTRIGTNPNDTKCAGPGGSHNNAVALRFYYDLSTRNSRFDATPSSLYFHSDGGGCDKPVATTDSKGVTTRTLTTALPPVPPALVKCKDSGKLNFNGGNPFTEVGSWTVIFP